MIDDNSCGEDAEPETAELTPAASEYKNAFENEPERPEPLQPASAGPVPKIMGLGEWLLTLFLVCIPIDPKKYQMEGPFLTPETCLYMVNTYKNLKCVGFDFLAIGSPCNDLAAPAHQNLLGLNTEKFITAIEDMNLSEF